MKAVCAKIKDREFYPELDEIGVWYGDAERRIWQSVYVEGQSVKAVKKAEVISNMTGRQFNSIRIDLDGKKKSRVEMLKGQEEDVMAKLESILEKIKLQKKKFGVPTKAKMAHLKVHLWKRQLQQKSCKLLEIQAELDANTPSLCFGSRALFYQQFNWETHGFASFEAWQAAWRAARSNHFYLVGCGKGNFGKCESGGNQSCVLTVNYYDHASQRLTGNLRLRLPKSQETEGCKYLNFPISFGYNSQHLYHALQTGQPITYQWIKRGKVWYVHAMVEEMTVPIVTLRSLGGMGIDCNPAFLSLGIISHDGNPVWFKDLVHKLDGKGSKERETILARLIKEAVCIAQQRRVPIIVEALDFKAKKREWKNAGYNKMLSSFAYRQFHKILLSTAARLGVEVITVNPRDTTTIGIIKFQGYGVSKDQGAAVAIARRGLGFTERVSGRGFSAPLLPAAKRLARDKSGHVTPSWSRLRRDLKLTGNGWQFKGVSVKARAKADSPEGCRTSRQGRGANPQSEQTPPVIRPVEPPTCDAAGVDARPNLVSVGARVPTPGGSAVQPPRSTRRKVGHRVSSEMMK